MKVGLLAKTKLGAWSLGLIAAVPILFYIGAASADSLYGSVPSGGTILEDIVERPVVALSMLAGMAAGISAFTVGLVAIIKQKERALTVYVATLAGMLLLLFLIGEVVFPH